MDLLYEEIDKPPWNWSNDENDYFITQWNGDLKKWETIWEKNLDLTQVPMDSELRRIRKKPGTELDIVKAGIVYEQMDSFRKTALEAYSAEREAQEDSRVALMPKILHDNAGHAADPEEGIYEPLSNSASMRVLELFPGDFDDEICCRLTVCTVDFEYPLIPLDRSSPTATLRVPTLHAVSQTVYQPVWFTALSYVWGDPTFVKTIICNGKPFKTTTNLERALRYLRQTDAAVILWIDQICINQADLKEKTQQVILMSKIYQRAWTTIAWLGEEADHSSDAIELLKGINAVLRFNYDERAPDPEDFERLFLPTPGSQQWSQLAKFLGRPWFQRVWIIQEIVLSNNIQVVCGAKCIPWLVLSIFAQCIIRHDLIRYLVSDVPAGEHFSESGCLRISKIDETKDYNYHFVGSAPLLSVLVEGRGAQATDLRDKVFAVMGMSTTIIYPEYSRTLSDIYTEAAQVTSEYDLVNSMCCVDHPQSIVSHPSWVPDWGTPRRTISLGYNGDHSGVYKAAAAKGLKPLLEMSEDRKSFFTSGVIFDHLSNISTSAGSHLQDLPNITSCSNKFVRESLQLAIEACQPYPSGSSLFDAFWETLVAGKDESGLIKAPSDFVGIFALLIDSATGLSPSIPDQPRSKQRLTLESLKVRRPSRIYRQMQIAFEKAVKGRRFGTTSKRYMGLFPIGARLGDEIFVLSGGHVPFVVRRQQASNRFQLVGECYVNGIMSGEVMQMTDLVMENIELI